MRSGQVGVQADKRERKGAGGTKQPVTFKRKPKPKGGEKCLLIHASSSLPEKISSKAIGPLSKV